MAYQALFLRDLPPAASTPYTLDGLPYAIKDLEPTAGVRATFGSRWFEHHVPSEDGVVAARLKAASCLGRPAATPGSSTAPRAPRPGALCGVFGLKRSYGRVRLLGVRG